VCVPDTVVQPSVPPPVPPVPQSSVPSGVVAMTFFSAAAAVAPLQRFSTQPA